MPPRDEPAPPPADGTTPKRTYQVEALTKGLRILVLFTEQRPSMKLTDMAAETGVPLSSRSAARPGAAWTWWSRPTDRCAGSPRPPGRR
ncbi:MULTISPECIES: helix-turn-helix domain-containing protein [Streptomyces]|uniref:Helix-turn-helix domain-containing protein n=1 Tax=Streptomyces sp. 900129855 TaxID=3155129 RepID=A0ABV2ZW24_9ACTN